MDLYFLDVYRSSGRILHNRWIIKLSFYRKYLKAINNELLFNQKCRAYNNANTFIQRTRHINDAKPVQPSLEDQRHNVFNIKSPDFQ